MKDQGKRLINESEAPEFRKKMHQMDYSIVKHLEKTPTQIFVWALLRSSQLHRQEALDDTYVSVGISNNNVAATLNQAS